MQASTAKEIEIYTKLLKLIEFAPQPQTQYETDPIAAATHELIASPSGVIQASSSAQASPAPEPAPEIAPSALELPSLPKTTSQPDPAAVRELISAVARCTAARSKARSEAFARSQSRYTADEAGAKAFRSAMPPLLGAENIREFIACVAHGMLIEVIGDRAATKLLYAAQVAFSAQDRTEPKRTPKSAASASENS